MNRKLFLILFGLLVSYLTTKSQWTQIGQIIYGEAAGDFSGYSVSLNSDGSVVAIGAPNNDGNTPYSGHVRVYQNISGTWTQIGQDIDGEEIFDKLGCSVSLSSDGSVVAIGAPYIGAGGQVRVYQNISGIWTQIGLDINGEAAGDFSGYSVSLSCDGSVVAIGATGNGAAGHVRVYQNISGTWTQIGQDIDGEAAGDCSGYSVSLNSDGSVVAIGAPSNEDNDYYSGHVRVYQNISGTWTQIGQDIDGNLHDFLGNSVSLSSDGSVVAIGAAGREGFCPWTGRVKVYQNISGTWTQIGQDIDNEALCDYSGYSVSLSSDGSVVAIGAPNNDGNGSSAGHVRVYQSISGTWTQIGLDIDGDSARDYSGYSVSLSSDGSVVAIGAAGWPDDPWSHEVPGYVKVYENIITGQPGNQSNICPGSNISYYVTGMNINSYQWQVNTGSVFEDIINGSVYSNATTDTLKITGVTIGMEDYQYRCCVTTNYNTVYSDTASLTLDTESPVITSSHFDQTLYLNENCEAVLPDYTGNVTATDNCDTNLAISQNPVAGTIISSTPNEVTLTVTDDCGNNTRTTFNIIAVEDSINPTITCVADQKINLSQGEGLYTVQGTEFDPTEINDNCEVASIINNFNSSSTLSGAQIPPGIETITWIISDNDGNTETCSFNVTVNTYTGIKTLQQKGISIYPNPTQGILNIVFRNINVQKLIISDITGKQIVEKMQLRQKEGIDISGFDRGVYIMRFYTNDEVITTKIIKE